MEKGYHASVRNILMDMEDLVSAAIILIMVVVTVSYFAACVAHLFMLQP